MARDISVTSFIPAKGEHAILIGKTGSGKTSLAIWIMLRIPTAPIVIYDTKLEPKFTKLPASKVVITIEEMMEAAQDVTVDYVIVRPPETMLGEPAKLDDYLWRQYLSLPDTVAYLDEGAEFHTSGGSPFKGLLSLMARGRSKGITTIVSTQRPLKISRSIVSEMTKAYIFMMQDRRERQVLDNLIPEFSRLPLPKAHAFYFWETGLNTAVLYEPIQLDKAFVTGYTDEAATREGNGVDDASTAPADAPQVTATKHVWV